MTTFLFKNLKFRCARSFDALVIRYDGVIPEKIKKVKAAGLEVSAWTVNSTEVMKQLLSIGIDRIYIYISS